MNRTRWLLAVIVVLIAANFGYRWWRGRGLITIHCEGWPASKVVHEIEKQGGVTVKSNVPPETQVKMHVDKVPVAEAMETLSTVVEARWRLAYVFAPKLPDIQAALAGFASGQRPEGWKYVFHPLGLAKDEADQESIPDPRTDPWTVKPVEKAEFQAYANQAARSVSAAFSFPESWNPPVSSPPASAAIRKAAPALAKAAGGKVLEVFLLEKPGSRNQDRLDPEEARRASEERALAELAKMSPEKRAAAQAQLDERQKLIAEMIVLTPEQRQNRISEYLSREDVQAGFEARMNEQVARMTPEQRVKHAQRYINYKKSVKDGGSAR